jgi:hypothetical protein
MIVLGIQIYTGGLIYGPPIDVNLTDDGTGTLHGTIDFVVSNAGDRDATVTFDVQPDPGTPASWFQVETVQLTVAAGGNVSFTVLVTVPADGGFERYHFRGRVRSPGLEPAVSEQARLSRPLPPGWYLRSLPDTYLDLSYPRPYGRPYDIAFSFEGPNVATRLLFDIGAPDAESAQWFNVERPVWPADEMLYDPLALTSDHPEWHVTVDAEALKASGRSGVWLQPFVSIDDPTGVLDPTGTFFEATGWKPYAYWFGYGVEVGG